MFQYFDIYLSVQLRISVASHFMKNRRNKIKNEPCKIQRFSFAIITVSNFSNKNEFAVTREGSSLSIRLATKVLQIIVSLAYSEVVFCSPLFLSSFNESSSLAFSLYRVFGNVGKS